MSNADEVNRLLLKLEQLQQQQQNFVREMNELKLALVSLKLAERATEETTPEPIIEPVKQPVAKEPVATPVFPPPVLERKTMPVITKPQVKSDWEKFIGENLINKIGIAITVIGVAIGAKYAIDHELISPLTRIILGYLFGGGLLAFAFRLKTNYANFSAVLLSGAMAILYFITFAAYSFYQLFPQALAFLLMVVFTMFTVVAALQYDRAVIAHFGLVGAYAVPFLLSDGSGQVGVMFSYMAIINVGILAIAVKKYWRSLYYVSFILTWLIFSSWFAFSYDSNNALWLSLGFATLFYLIFYLVFLAYKLIKQEQFVRRDIVLLITNSFIYYGLGYAILDDHSFGQHWVGVFTVLNGLVHFIVTVIIYKQKLADKNLFYLVAGLVLIFITIAVPVQLDGNWVTLLWSGEAALLFWIGRSKQVKLYESFSYVLMLVAFISLTEDWYNGNSLLASVFFALSFGFIVWFDRNKTYPSTWSGIKGIQPVISYVITGALIFVLYNMFRIEIADYWSNRYQASEIQINVKGADSLQYFGNTDLLKFGQIWLINYTLFFFSALSFVNIRKIKSSGLAYGNLIINLLIVLVFLSQGLLFLSQLRESYLAQSLATYYKQDNFSILIRYISLSFLALMVYMIYLYSKQSFIEIPLTIPFGLFLHVIILWVASSELIHLLDMAAIDGTYKLGLSILWGSYSLLLISLGIWKKKKYLRIAAIALFALTLLKLFFYDISALSSIAKTIVFVALGILLLVISFLYNKYKHLIADEATS